MNRRGSRQQHSSLPDSYFEDEYARQTKLIAHAAELRVQRIKAEPPPAARSISPEQHPSTQMPSQLLQSSRFSLGSQKEDPTLLSSSKHLHEEQLPRYFLKEHSRQKQLLREVQDLTTPSPPTSRAASVQPGDEYGRSSEVQVAECLQESCGRLEARLLSLSPMQWSAKSSPRDSSRAVATLQERIMSLEASACGTGEELAGIVPSPQRLLQSGSCNAEVHEAGQQQPPAAQRELERCQLLGDQEPVASSALCSEQLASSALRSEQLASPALRSEQLAQLVEQQAEMVCILRKHGGERDHERKMLEEMLALHERSRQSDLEHLERLQRTIEALTTCSQ